MGRLDMVAEGAGLGGMITVVQMLVLLEALGSGWVPELLACVTVAQFLNVLPGVTANENRAKTDSPGASDLVDVQGILAGTGTLLEPEQLRGKPGPDPQNENSEPGAAVGVSVNVRGAADDTCPIFLMVTVHRTVFGRVSAHVLVTLKSAAVDGGRHSPW